MKNLTDVRSPDDPLSRSLSPVLRAPVMNNSDVPFSEQKHGSKMIPYRHHLFHTKLTKGKVLCSRALIEKESAKKYIQTKFNYFKHKLYSHKHKTPSKGNSASINEVQSDDLSDEESVFGI